MTATLELRLFGPFEARVRGALLPPLRTRKDAWVLALLVLHAGRPLHRSWLAGTLWPDSFEPAALANLRKSLKSLRRALGTEAVRLLAPTPRTLLLDLANADVDLLCFDAAITRGDSAALAQSVAIYRGPFLDGCVEVWVFQERQWREEACLAALERLADEALGRGDWVEAERCLRRALAIHPLRESAHRGLMQALVCGGSDAAALAVYRELRLLLNRELCAAPSRETTALFEVIRVAARGQARHDLLRHRRLKETR
jgi:DNA-binding SARP family transcriptional activator